MKVRLFEIFTSIEGEGILFGTKTLFVRLAGCPFTCFYCDTKDSLPLDSGTEYSLVDAIQLIEKNIVPNTYKVNFTGGDPLVQYQAVAEIAKHIQEKKIKTYLESSCYDSEKFLAVMPFIDIIKIEFKTRDSEFVDEKHYEKLLENALRCLKYSISAKKLTYIKIVVSDKTSIAHFSELVNRIFDIALQTNISGFIIQPTFGIAEPTLDNLLKMYDIVYPKFNDVRVVPQLHKIIGAP